MTYTQSIRGQAMEHLKCMIEKRERKKSNHIKMYKINRYKYL